ncbi:MAG TPA: hypothetical protein VG872_05675 [Acidimicrobiia bacterium]|jgi:hypothetical protein|nr:hypothetical protein [Acidimicrobiia bacterium]
MRRHRRLIVLALVALVVVACGPQAAEEETSTTSTVAAPTTTSAPATTTTEAETETTTDSGQHDMGDTVDPAEIAAASLATAAFQDVEMAEAAGYGSTMDALGCFESAESGGMGLHYLNESLMDDVVDITTPEALVYELDADGEITGLVAHEYIVPVEAWTGTEPPSLFGMEFHQHPVLPLWVMHAWIWKDNPSGMFVDFNPKVRLCPEGVPVFGVDLP